MSQSGGNGVRQHGDAALDLIARCQVLRKGRAIPHGLDREDVCTAIDQDIENPEKTEYTFGFPLETLTESHARTIKGLQHSINDQHRWLTETETALNINVEAVNLIGHRTTQLEIDVDAAEEAITLKASQDSVDILEEKHNEVVLRLDAAEGTITAQAEEINLKANKTYVDNLVAKCATVEELETVQSWATDFTGVTVNVSFVGANEGDFDKLYCGLINDKDVFALIANLEARVKELEG